MSGELTIIDQIRGKTVKAAELPQKNRRDSSPMVRATRYDVALPSTEDAKHFAYADSLSANLSLQPGTRLILRNRARYEIANNSYAKGVVLTKASDIIGTGPRLQVTTSDSDLNRRIESRWSEWWEAVDGARKLFVACQAKIGDGEGFAILHKYDSLPCAVKLGIRLIEAEQVSTPPPAIPIWPFYVDGVELDEGYNARAYHLLRWHPGDMALANVGMYDTVDARYILHWFRADRPGQYRGVPEIVAALKLFAQLRRFSLAVLAAAETAADFAAVLQSSALPGEDADDIEPLDTIELEKRMLTTLPRGWTLGQIDARQPTTTYSMFKSEILNEIFRCLNMPYNVGACNSSNYNYSSGRLDHQTYDGALRLDQADCERQWMRKVFSEWWTEARLIYPEFDGAPAMLEYHWMWQRRQAGDPVEDANAATLRMQNGTSSLPEEFARLGKDWETEMSKASKALGITVDEYRTMLRTKLFGSMQQSSSQSDINEDQGDNDDQPEDTSKKGGKPYVTDPSADPNAKKVKRTPAGQPPPASVAPPGQSSPVKSR